ncbi:transposase [Pollutibacter soli]|uniref:transposase n=1 Tax=Pollutibacter soli TaxID=3034157 RepID=UPI003013EA68
MKVPLLKAFGMIFRISVKKKGISTLELSREFAIDKKTAWLFKRKIQEVMSGGQQIQLNDPIDSTSFTFGGAELEWKSKFQGEESNAILMVEKTKRNKLGNARGRMATEADSIELIEKLKSNNKSAAANAASIKNPKTILEKIDFNIPDPSGKRGVQILVFNLKNWLRGIHHHCSGRFANGYLQEFIFRFNRRNNLKMILHQVIQAGIYHQPYFYKPFNPRLGNRPLEEKPLTVT